MVARLAGLLLLLLGQLRVAGGTQAVAVAELYRFVDVEVRDDHRDQLERQDSADQVERFVAVERQQNRDHQRLAQECIPETTADTTTASGVNEERSQQRQRRDDADQRKRSSPPEDERNEQLAGQQECADVPPQVPEDGPEVAVTFVVEQQHLHEQADAGVDHEGCGQVVGELPARQREGAGRGVSDEPVAHVGQALVAGTVEHVPGDARDQCVKGAEHLLAEVEDVDTRADEQHHVVHNVRDEGTEQAVRQVDRGDQDATEELRHHEHDLLVGLELDVLVLDVGEVHVRPGEVPDDEHQVEHRGDTQPAQSCRNTDVQPARVELLEEQRDEDHQVQVLARLPGVEHLATAVVVLVQTNHLADDDADRDHEHQVDHHHGSDRRCHARCVAHVELVDGRAERDERLDSMPEVDEAARPGRVERQCQPGSEHCPDGRHLLLAGLVGDVFGSLQLDRKRKLPEQTVRRKTARRQTESVQFSHPIFRVVSDN